MKCSCKAVHFEFIKRERVHQVKTLKRDQALPVVKDSPMGLMTYTVMLEKPTCQDLWVASGQRSEKAFRQSQGNEFCQ